MMVFAATLQISYREVLLSHRQAHHKHVNVDVLLDRASLEVVFVHMLASPHDTPVPAQATLSNARVAFSVCRAEERQLFQNRTRHPLGLQRHSSLCAKH